jgi:hypothetical protein
MLLIYCFVSNLYSGQSMNMVNGKKLIEDTLTHSIYSTKPNSVFSKIQFGIFHPLKETFFRDRTDEDYITDKYQSSKLFSLAIGTSIVTNQKVFEYGLSTTYVNLIDSSFRCTPSHGSCGGEDRYTTELNFIFLQIPLTWYSLNHRLKIKYGLKFSYMIFGNKTENGATFPYNSNYTWKIARNKRFDLGPHWGMGYLLNNGVMINLNHSLSLIGHEYRSLFRGFTKFNQEFTFGCTYYFNKK